MYINSRFTRQFVRNITNKYVPLRLLVAGPLALALSLSSGCEQERYALTDYEPPCGITKVCDMKADGTITKSNALYLGNTAIFLATIKVKAGVPFAILEIVDGCGESFFIGPFKDGQKGKVIISNQEFDLVVSEITKDSAYAMILVSCEK